MSWKTDTKRFNQTQRQVVKCECGHSILTARKFTICSWCGKKVYSHKEQFKDKLQKAMGGLNGSYIKRND